MTLPAINGARPASAPQNNKLNPLAARPAPGTLMYCLDKVMRLNNR